LKKKGREWTVMALDGGGPKKRRNAKEKEERK